jgi:hypothetical protein
MILSSANDLLVNLETPPYKMTCINPKILKDPLEVGPNQDCPLKIHFTEEP